MRILSTAGLALLACMAQARADEFLGKDARAWLAGLKSTTPEMRRSAAFALGKLGSSAVDAMPALLHVARKDPSPRVREAAAFALGEIAKNSLRASNVGEVVPVLTQVLGNDDDPLVRRSAAYALGCTASDEALPGLVAALEDRSPLVRQSAAWALGKVGPAAVPGLRKALGDDDPLVKRDAATSLRGLPSKAVRPALSELLALCREKNSENRRVTLAVLAQIVGPEDAGKVPAIQPALSDDDDEVRNNAALVLANIGGPEAVVAVPILVKALRQADVDMKRQAAAALRNIGPDAHSAVPELTRALADPDAETRGHAAMALGGIGKAAEKAYPLLAKMLVNDKEPVDNRVEAAVAMSRIGECPAAVEAVPALLDVLGNPAQNLRVRERIVWALRVHAENLQRLPNVYPTFEKVIKEPKTHDSRMLRYDCAYMLGMLQGPKVSEGALDTLHDFLKDNSIQIFVNKKTTVSATTAETNPGKATVQELGKGDGRVMAAQALSQIGPDRISKHRGIPVQLRALVNSSTTDPDLQKRCRELLRDLR